jgi:nucleoside-diphosphate-sugar epimerase
VLNNDGTTRRSYIHSFDAARHLARLADLDAFPFSCVNLTNPDSISLLELANAIIAAAGSRSVAQKGDSVDARQYVFDNSRLATCSSLATLSIKEALSRSIVLQLF